MIGHKAFCLLLSDTVRGRAYCAALKASNHLPTRAIVLKSDSKFFAAAQLNVARYFDDTAPLKDVLQAWRVPIVELETTDVNAPAVRHALLDEHEDLVIYCAPPGAVANPALLRSKRYFLHAHSGRLPTYRGSTPFYYSLLAESRLHVSAILLTDEIDRGPVVAELEFPLPEDASTLDMYDAWIRAQAIAAVVDGYVQRGGFATSPVSGEASESLYVIHPVLRHLAILKADRPIKQN